MRHMDHVRCAALHGIHTESMRYQHRPLLYNIACDGVHPAAQCPTDAAYDRDRLAHKRTHIHPASIRLESTVVATRARKRLRSELRPQIPDICHIARLLLAAHCHDDNLFKYLPRGQEVEATRSRNQRSAPVQSEYFISPRVPIRQQHRLRGSLQQIQKHYSSTKVHLAVRELFDRIQIAVAIQRKTIAHLAESSIEAVCRQGRPTQQPRHLQHE